ncbi:sigma-70 family RNA polymerase sigma factor [Rubrivivax rivuli]|uniref:Sigma-70 family RNA polymerase sigma factor n=1 Tax=Rubrivivax rivuli TaxID=1862385 RepID=A0A437R9E6_9BURK|nr:sigma-70 family RNA polymerase sigma factor [Rubrivivax rivuli]RVU43408.1 sigma-70 family RNA polymerase sigma factor [Rubrivivax rivuli]
MSIESELAALHPYLLRFAQMQLRHDSLAEDVVSETLLAILEKPENFEGRSSLRTYATGILKFKVIDVLRKRGREVHVEVQDDQSLDEALEALFQKDGHWKDPPAAWQQPESSLEQRQFFEQLQACVDKLPPRTGRVFMMREWLEQEVDEICQELGISANNCGVILYRARMQLRDCLERHWFAGQR